MPGVHIGNVDREQYSEAEINLSKVAGEVMFTRTRTAVSVSHTDGKLHVQVPYNIEHTDAWPGRGECVCAPASAPLTELGFAHVPACVERLFGCSEALFVLVYTTDLNVFLMFVPVLRVGAEYVALFPWNGYCDEDGEAAMLGKKTFVQAVCSIDETRVRIESAAAAQGLDADRVQALLEVADSYALLVTQFQRSRMNLHSVANECITCFTSQSTHSGFLTYTSVTPGVLLSVGHANYLISHGTASESLCVFVLGHVLALTTDRELQTPRDGLWLCFLVMFCLKLAHRAAGVPSYRLEKGEDIRPDFAPKVYGTMGDCEDHMGSFLSIVHTLCTNGMLRGTAFEHAQLTPDNSMRAYAARGLMYHDEDKSPEIHAFTVIAQVENDSVCLHIVENTCCVFVYRSKEQQDAVAQALAAYDHGLVAFESEAHMQQMYRIQWLDKRVVFVFECGGGAPATLSQDAAPYTAYRTIGVFDQSVQKLQRYLCSMQEGATRRKHLVLMHPVLFLQAFEFLQQYAHKQLAGTDEAQRLAVAEYVNNTEVQHPWWKTIFAERQESMDDAARDMAAAIQCKYGRLTQPVYDLRLLPRTLSNAAPVTFANSPPMLHIVRSTLCSALQTLKNMDQALRVGLNSNNAPCLCIVHHTRVFFASVDTISGFYAKLIRAHAQPLKRLVSVCDMYRQQQGAVVCIQRTMLYELVQCVLSLIHVITYCLHATP